MDAYQLWREGVGQSKHRMVRSVWPELADALDGTNAGDSGTPEAEQPPCSNCGAASGRLAVCRAGNIAVCGLCAGLAEFRAMGLVRVTQWHAGRRR